MPDDVRLAEVTADNWRDVVNLELNNDQKGLLASNVYSIAESKFNLLARPRAVYAGDQLVGFLMYETGDAAGKPGGAMIYRFMIDRRHQGKGYGRAALKAAIAELSATPGVRTVLICYFPENTAKKLYASLGFVEVETGDEDEIIAELPLNKDAP